MSLSLEERLKDLILEKYGDMKTFAIKAGIPNSTLSSMFQRGIFNSTIGRVIQLTSALNISIDELVHGNIISNIRTLNEHDNDPYITQIDECYNRLNDSGKKEACRRVSELTEIPRYTALKEPSVDKEAVLKLLETPDDDDTMTLVAKGGNGVKHIKVSKEATEAALRLLEALNERNNHD